MVEGINSIYFSLYRAFDLYINNMGRGAEAGGKRLLIVKDGTVLLKLELYSDWGLSMKLNSNWNRFYEGFFFGNFLGLIPGNLIFEN